MMHMNGSGIRFDIQETYHGSAAFPIWPWLTCWIGSAPVVLGQMSGTGEENHIQSELLLVRLIPIHSN